MKLKSAIWLFNHFVSRIGAKFVAQLVAMMLVAVLGLPSSPPPAVAADTLQGQVEKDTQLLRINRPSGTGLAPAAAPDFRIGRPLSGSRPLSGNVVDTTAFAAPLTGNAQKDAANGVVQAAQFAPAPARNFDLGADANSKELVLAWERWHQQLSRVIYERWTQRADRPGVATVRVTVTRDHQIHAEALDSHGRGDFLASLMDAIEGLNGNPGLTFPVGSQRKDVSFEADYLAGHNVTPGYSWVHNDYEVIHQNY